MPEKPVMHGREHRPGGMDPIPGLGSSAQSWAYLEPGLGGTTVAATTTAPVGGQSGSMYTNDSSVFAEASRVISGTTYYGISFLKVGHYWVEAQLILVGIVPAGQVFAIDEAASDAFDSSFDFLGQANTNDSRSVLGVWLQTVDGSGVIPPTGALILACNNAGGSSVTADMSVKVTYLDSDATVLN